MVNLPKGRKTYRLRVLAPSGRESTLSTGCRTEADAEDVEAVYDLWAGVKGKKHARPDVLEALVARQVTLVDAYEAHCAGTLNALMAALEAEVPDVDLHPQVTAFKTWKGDQKKGGAQAAEYARMVHVLYPADKPFGLRQFTRKELAARLDALPFDSPTKNRYKTGLSQFAKYLVRVEVLETNFTRDIEGFGENPERVVYYERPDAQRLIAGLAQPYAGIAALMAGFCMEWGAASRAIALDVQLTADPIAVRIRGTKRAWRDRVVPLVPENAWVLPYIRTLLAGKMPAARLTAGLQKWTMLRVQQRVATALELVAVGEDVFGQHNVHDWRHTHTVQLLRDGYADQIAAKHLGHKDTSLVQRRYGKYKPTAQDYARRTAR